MKIKEECMITQTTHQQDTTTKSVNLPKWVSGDYYPFKSKVINIEGNTIHYIDEGTGPVILMSHAACAWSFIFRDIIKVLSRNYRCIALDYPGFGFSTASETYEYTIEAQSNILLSFISELGLSEIYFLGHDTGGPSGFYLAAQYPDLFKGLIISDTIVYPTNEYRQLHYMLHLLGTWPLKIINQWFNIVVWAMLNNFKSAKVPVSVKQHYFRIFQTFEKRERIRKLLVSLRKSTDIMTFIKNKLHSDLIRKPALLIYGTKDPVYKLGIPERILSTLKNAELHMIKDEGHFPHEGNGHEIGIIIESWLNKILNS
jgi:haloalkane dehalogenase